MFDFSSSILYNQRKFYSCVSCGEIVQHLYQENQCKICTAKEIRKLIPMLNASHACNQNSQI